MREPCEAGLWETNFFAKLSSLPDAVSLLPVVCTSVVCSGDILYVREASKRSPCEGMFC